ncbi:hypothetical protein [Streptacidiphilus sp. EB129]|uniref:hypothetical protein n=1 Tax=Streptacidiphilus sp. EB129 TaxID=3156262 RepID=UPI003515DEDD
MTTVGEHRPEADAAAGVDLLRPEGTAPRGPGRRGLSAVRLPRRVRRRDVPSRLRLATVGCVLLTAVLGAVVVTSALGAQNTWSTVTDHQAPQVLDATALYQSLTDLDAQTANLLVFGDDPRLSAQRATALTQYAQDRTDADRDLQHATLDAAGDTEVQQSLAAVLDGMGSYQDLAARAMELNDRTHAGAGHPDPTALAQYRKATDLMRTALLPAADRLVQANNDAYNRSYTAERSALSTAGLWTVALGTVLLLSLLGLQLWLARRFRRIVNPALAAATLVAVTLVALAGSLWSDEGEQMRVARHDAFDSVVALTRARAVAYDANADESRYLLDQGRAGQYQDAFEAASVRIASLPGVTISDYDAQLAAAVTTYQANHADVRFGGFYGDEFRNITFTGERAAAEQALTAYQAYERDDRTIRSLVAQGRQQDAIVYGVSMAQGGSDADFTAHDAALQKVIAINDDAFTAAAHRGGSELSARIPMLAGGAALVLLLCLIGVRPRLGEFRH